MSTSCLGSLTTIQQISLGNTSNNVSSVALKYHLNFKSAYRLHHSGHSKRIQVVSQLHMKYYTSYNIPVSILFNPLLYTVKCDYRKLTCHSWFSPKSFQLLISPEPLHVSIGFELYIQIQYTKLPIINYRDLNHSLTWVIKVPGEGTLWHTNLIESAPRTDYNCFSSDNTSYYQQPNAIWRSGRQLYDSRLTLK
jgi:hypothetical protein